jgi:hypothetical protein
MTGDIIEAPSGGGSIEVLIRRTTSSSQHPSTVVLSTDTLTQIGVQSGDTVRLRTDDGGDVYAVAETNESTGLDVGAEELLADVPVLAGLSCGPRQRVSVSRASLPKANHFSVTPIDPATRSVIERCSVGSAGLVDAVAYDDGIVEFRPSDVAPEEPPGPYYAGIDDICPGTPARVTAETGVDVSDPDRSERPSGVLSPDERRELIRANLTERPADDELRGRLRERLESSFQDLRLLAHRLPDDDLERVFDKEEPSWMATVTTDVVALCWLGLALADDEPAWRVEEGIKRALFAQEERGEVELRVTSQPALPAPTVLERFRRHGSKAIDTYGALDRLWASSEVDTSELYEVTSEQLGEDFAIPPAALELERLAYRTHARRFPLGQVIDVSAESDTEHS